MGEGLMLLSTGTRSAHVRGGEGKRQLLLRTPNWQCRMLSSGVESKPPLVVVPTQTQTQPVMMIIKNQMVTTPTYSSRITTDIPLYESPGASFDQYMEDKPRLFNAIFPEKQRSQQLNQEEWRIHMLPIQFLFLTVRPVIDMRLRCKSEGIDYPADVPGDITKVLELEIIKWDLQGLDDILKPSHFSLGVKGAMYPDRRGTRICLKGQLQMSMSFVLPPVLALVPEDIRRDVAERVLKRLVENMKVKVNGSLLADYGEFKSEKLKNFGLS